MIRSKDCPEFLMKNWQSRETVQDMDSLENFLYELGFPFAVVEETEHEPGRKEFQVNCGPEIKYVQVTWRQDSGWYLLSEEERTSIFSWEEMEHHRVAALHEMARSGYPYARLLTFPQKVEGDTLILEYGLDSVRSIWIREITVSGDLNIHLPMFRSMIGLKENQRFDVDRIRRSEEIIDQWDFAELETIRYDFNPFGINLEYVMNEKKPSRFDLLIALVPSNRPRQQYELTGNAYVDLQNQLNRAERIFFRFDKYANSSQSIDLRLNFPYLQFLRSGIMAEGGMDRRDSSVMDVGGKFGLQYSWNHKSIWAVFLEREQSRLITIEEEWLRRNGILPEELDYNFTAGGISMDINLLDQRMNPRNGYLGRVELSGGIRKIVPNGKILSIEPERPGAESFDRQYDHLAKPVMRASAFISLERYFPVGLYSTFRTRAMGKWLWASQELLENEKMRLGGFQDFRGFPEKIFLSDGFGMGTLEYRFLFGPESNVYVFSDFGLLYHPDRERSMNFPYSLGLGLNLGTKAGIFGISYAIGGHRNIPFSLSQSRVNFGLIVNY